MIALLLLDILTNVSDEKKVFRERESEKVKEKIRH